jgi:RimJ/RimL family protein N-acetyltransferase
MYYRIGDFYIKPVNQMDGYVLMEHRNDFDTWSNLTTPEPITPNKQIEWIKSLEKAPRQFFMLCKGVVKIGMIRMDELDLMNRSCRVGLDIFKDHRGNKYSYNGWELVLKYCFDELNMHRVWLLVLENNEIAMKVYNTLGFIKEGVMRKAVYRGGKYMDYIMMSLLKGES